MSDSPHRVNKKSESNLGKAASPSLTAENNYAIGYNGMPLVYPQICPFPFDDLHSYLIHPSSTDPTHHPKRDPYPISRFATVHPPDRPTSDRQTDRPKHGIGSTQVCHFQSSPYTQRIQCSTRRTRPLNWSVS